MCIRDRRDFASFLREIRAAPGRFSYATSGTGGNSHIKAELFELETRTFMAHIPYRGTGPALVDVVAGHVPIIFGDLPSALPHIQAGRLVPIVVGAPQRSAQIPNVPTFAEVGLPRVNRMAFFGLHGPRGLPREVVALWMRSTTSRGRPRGPCRPKKAMRFTRGKPTCLLYTSDAADE